METQLSLFDAKIPCKEDYGRKIKAYYRNCPNPLKGEYRGFDNDFKCHYVLAGLRLYHCHLSNYRFEFINS